MADETGGAIDFAYLEGIMAGDRAVVKEVLGLFRQSVDRWAPGLSAEVANWRDVVHTIKGTALGVGAHRLGELCARAETEGPDLLPEIRKALADAGAAIDAYVAKD